VAKPQGGTSDLEANRAVAHLVAAGGLKGANGGSKGANGGDSSDTEESDFTDDEDYPLPSQASESPSVASGKAQFNEVDALAAQRIGKQKITAKRTDADANKLRQNFKN
jgi:hypothetical protein